jgi:hypothetical protein
MPTSHGSESQETPSRCAREQSGKNFTSLTETCLKNVQYIIADVKLCALSVVSTNRCKLALLHSDHGYHVSLELSAFRNDEKHPEKL